MRAALAVASTIGWPIALSDGHAAAQAPGEELLVLVSFPRR